jgi:hypothetical protein
LPEIHNCEKKTLCESYAKNKNKQELLNNKIEPKKIDKI